MHRAVAGSHACLNCGAALHGRFCAGCGQEDRPLDPTVGEVVGEVVREISALDGRIIRSVRRLFLSPGYLTREHFEGHRAGWVSPVRLYLILSVVYFGIASFAGATPLHINFNYGSDGGGNDEEASQALQQLGFSSEQEMRHAVDQALTVWIPRAMFVLVPLFGWLVSRVRQSSGRRYPHHVIFALHILAAFFGVQAVATLAGYLTGREGVTAVFGVAAIVYVVVYTVAAMRRVYGGTMVRAVAHTVVVLALYWVAMLLTTVAIVLPVLQARSSTVVGNGTGAP